MCAGGGGGGGGGGGVPCSCTEDESGRDCAPVRATPLRTWSAGLSRPQTWAYGGAGYVLSRGLLRAILEREWAQCERGMLSDGGDVRVSSCVWTFGGVGLTQLPGLLSGLSRHRCEGGGKVGGEGGGGGGGNRSAASAYFAKRRALLRSLKKP